MILEAALNSKCPKCHHSVVVCARWMLGGAHKYGGFIVECDECGKNQDLRIGRDVNLSEVVYGAQLLGIYDEYVKGQRNAVRAKFGVMVVEVAEKY